VKPRNDDLKQEQPAPRSRKSPLSRRVRRWFRSLSLLSAAGLTLLGLFVFAAFAWFVIGFATIGGFTWEITSSGITRSQVAQIALTMAGGAGAAVALVVTYRRHSRLEEGSFLERLGVATAQLGDDKASVQFSGVYALSALADESDAVRRQQVIDVLCGYLRVPYDPAISGQAGVQTRAEKIIYKEGDEGDQKEITVTTVHKPGEKEVRATILRVIRDHLKPDAVSSWSELRFDFTGAVIDDCDLTNSQFSGDVRFDRAKFCGKASFSNAEFSAGKVSFFRAEFPEGLMTFDHAKCSGGEVNFLDARFSGGAVSFDDAEFSGGNVTFPQAKFSRGRVSFVCAKISGGNVTFRQAAFSGGSVSFVDAKFFRGEVTFASACISGGEVSFAGAEFSGANVYFHRARFIQGSSVSFETAKFSAGAVDLTTAYFSGGNVSFETPWTWDVPPKVPWNKGDELPAGVQPREWPPKLSWRAAP
jgi:uncharacterized protein YjbI with pentapeptide repeats